MHVFHQATGKEKKKTETKDEKRYNNDNECVFALCWVESIRMVENFVTASWRSC